MSPLALLVPCATVALTGDAAVVAALGARLDDRGLGPPVPGCARTDVHVDSRGGRITLELAAGEAEPIRRQVATLEAAAALVEMWARPELPPPPPRPAPAPRIPAAPSRGPSLQPSAAAELGVDDAGRSWAGGSLRVSRRTGDLDLALVARGSSATRAPGALRSGAGLVSADLLLAAELPLRAGPIALVPGLAAGAGWTSVSRGGACDGCLLVDDGFVRDGVDPRIEVHLGAGWPLSTVLAAELWLGCTFNPSGGASIAPAYARALGDDGREALSLPGPPRLLARAGLGLRVLP